MGLFVIHQSAIVNAGISLRFISGSNWRPRPASRDAPHGEITPTHEAVLRERRSRVAAARRAESARHSHPREHRRHGVSVPAKSDEYAVRGPLRVRRPPHVVDEPGGDDDYDHHRDDTETHADCDCGVARPGRSALELETRGVGDCGIDDQSSIGHRQSEVRPSVPTVGAPGSRLQALIVA